MTLTPARRDYLRHIHGEHMEGVEVVSITRADLDALLQDGAKVSRVGALADSYELTAGMLRSNVEDKRLLEAVVRDIRAELKEDPR